MKVGDYYKAIGGDFGVVWNGQQWKRYACQTCASHSGLLKNRLQGPMTEAAGRAFNGTVFYPCIGKHTFREET